MIETKQRNMIIAGTVGAVLLLVILLSILVYQLITIGVKNKKVKALEAETARYEELLKQGEDSLDCYTAKWYIEGKARELGYLYPDEINLNK